MLAVAGGADGRGGNAPGYRLAMYARVVLAGHVAMAHAAEVGNCLMELGGGGALDFMSATVTDGAIRSGRIAILRGLAVHAAGPLRGDLGMALGAGGLGKASRVRKVLVPGVTGNAGQGGVRGNRQLLSLIVTGGAGAPGGLAAPTPAAPQRANPRIARPIGNA